MANDKKKMMSRLRTIIMGILLVVMIVSGIGVIRDQIESQRQREEQQHLAQMASQTTAESAAETETEMAKTQAPYVSPIDFEALQTENPDVVGWIRIPDTRIDYPILHTDDNETYLDTDFDGNKSVYGSIYLDCDSSPDFRGWNNPIYGHHMKDGSMFKDVVRFKDPEYFKEHQYFEIYTPDRTIRLKAVSCYYTGSNGIVRKTRFSSQESFDEWMMERLEPCEYAEIPEVQVGSMFVLVTCSYEMSDARTLLYAVEVDEEGQVIPSDKAGYKPEGSSKEGK